MLGLLPLFFSCQQAGSPAVDNPSPMKSTITKSSFGSLPDGRAVDLFTLTNKNGVEARITNFGGTVVSLKTPDRNGQLEDIVLGFDDLSGYLENGPYFGALIGRFANRIGGAKFTLEGKTYQLTANVGGNHLHGGMRGFGKVLWEAVPDSSKPGEAALHLSYTSPDMEEGYPGNLDVRVTYSLTDNNELKIRYIATTDKTTVANLTHHSYFNLTGGVKSDVLGHLVQINANAFTPMGPDLVTTGELAALANSPLDFRTAKPIGRDIEANDEQVSFGRGYDHNYVLTAKGDLKAVAAKVVEPTSGRAMEVYTTEPGMQFYTGNFLDGTVVGKGGKAYQKRAGFCFETQHFPDSPNKPQFPSTVLKPRYGYESTTVYRFFVEK